MSFNLRNITKEDISIVMSVYVIVSILTITLLKQDGTALQTRQAKEERPAMMWLLQKEG